MKTLTCLLLLLASFANAADVLPTTGKAVGFIRDDTPGFWLVLAQDFTPVEAKFFEGDDAKGYRGCVFEGPPGTRYMAIKIENGRPKTFPVILSGTIPGPIIPGPITPDPPPKPDPKPDPPPDPKPDPTIAGPRQVFILRESANDTPAMSRLITSLQAGKGRDYLVSKGHNCFIFDGDDKDSTGQPSPVVAKWKETVKIPLPWIAIRTTNGGKVLHSQALTGTETADDIIAIVKQWEAK